MKLEHIKNLLENIRVNLYNSENYKIECTKRDGLSSLEIERIDRDAYLIIWLEHPEKYEYKASVYTGQITYGNPTVFNLSKEEYENINSFITEWVTTHDLINECIAIDAFNL